MADRGGFDAERGALTASRDHLIEEVVSDPRWRVDAFGRIWRRKASGEWRRADTVINKSHAGTRWHRTVHYKNKGLLAHRIAYRALVGPLDERYVINHKDGDSLNNEPANLELVSQAENNEHARKVLRVGNAVGGVPRTLTAEQVEQMRSLRATGATVREVARQFNTSFGTARRWLLIGAAK